MVILIVFFTEVLLIDAELKSIAKRTGVIIDFIFMQYGIFGVFKKPIVPKIKFNALFT